MITLFLPQKIRKKLEQNQPIVWLINLAIIFIVLFLVPMQLFGMGFRITRMDAGILEIDADLFARIIQRKEIPVTGNESHGDLLSCSRGRQLALDRFGWPGYLARLREVYQRVLDERTGYLRRAARSAAA